VEMVKRERGRRLPLVWQSCRERGEKQRGAHVCSMQLRGWITQIYLSAANRPDFQSAA
jgi:hypothetical protein